MSDRLRLTDIMDLFEAAIDKPPADRESFLDDRCDSPDMRRRLEAMLAGHDQGDQWLGAMASVDADEVFKPPAEPPMPEHIGQFKIRRQIAAGGMGIVYEAQQENPRRTVAIKVMLKRLAQRGAFQRFHEEIQILGQLRHPAIAHIYEAGLFRDDGNELPYFVMEYIPDATAITTYADQKGLSVRERIELFIKVCEGVHHGHQRGIVHRDLKPDNLLVDEVGQPKIIDFGVASAADADPDVTTHWGDADQIIGTLRYMSPEQIEGNRRDIDWRSDVYALGIVLFELLTGETPHDITGLSVSQALHVLQETRPIRLSSLRPRLRGDLETIVNCSIDRDRERRYHSALELGRDLKRFLTGDAIVARPPSLLYYLRVIARRNRLVAGALAGLVLVLVVTSIATSSLYIRTEQARAEAAAHRDLSASTLSFLEWALTAIEPNSPGDFTTAQEILDEATRRLENGEFETQPQAEASIRQILARSYQSQKMYSEAQPHLERVAELHHEVLGPESRETLQARINVVLNLAMQSKAYQCGLAEDILLTCRRVLPPDDPLLRDAIWAYALDDQSVDAWKAGLDARIAIDGPDSPSAHFGMAVWGGIQAREGNPKEGRQFQERALQYFTENPVDWSKSENLAERGVGRPEIPVRSFLAFTYITLGLYGKAETVLGPLMPELAECRKGDRKPWAATAGFYVKQAEAIAGQGRMGQAEAMLRADLQDVRAAIGDGQSVTKQLAILLADVLREMGQTDEALEIAFGESQYAGLLSNRDPWVSEIVLRSKVLFDSGRIEEAGMEAEQVLARVGPDFILFLNSRLSVAEILHANGSLAEARQLLEPTMQYYDEKCDAAHPYRSRARCLAGRILADEGEVEAAESMLCEALALDLEFRGPDDRETAKSRLALGQFLLNGERFKEARAELEEAHRIFNASPFHEGLWLPRVQAALSALDDM